jgi:hypothetical protein
MKRNEQIWWLMIGLTFSAFFTMALFHFTNDSLKNDQHLTTFNSTVTTNLFANHNSKNDLPSQDKNDKQSPKELLVYQLQAISVNNVNYSIAIREIMPFWEITFEMKESRILIGSFLPILVILVFLTFYQTARTNSEDDKLTQSCFYQ